MSHEVLEFADLTPFLLLKNGNYLYKVPFRGGHAVLKVYYGSRPMWETVAKSVGNVVFEGQTSYMPRTRLAVERECLDLWHHHGFRVFERYDDVEVRAPESQCPPGGYLLTEYVDAPKLIDHMRDESVPEDERFATWRRFLPEWARRHEIAVAEREPRLIHENGDCKHVMLLGDEFLYFDFEMVYRARGRVEEYVGHEIVQFVWQLLRNIPASMQERLIRETAMHYPKPEFVELGYEVFHHHPKALPRLGRAVDRRLKRSRKPTSKYNVASRLRTVLTETR